MFNICVSELRQLNYLSFVLQKIIFHFNDGIKVLSL